MPSAAHVQVAICLVSPSSRLDWLRTVQTVLERGETALEEVMLRKLFLINEPAGEIERDLLMCITIKSGCRDESTPQSCEAMMMVKAIS